MDIFDMDILACPSPRLSCVLILDNSGDMIGEPSYLLNQAVQQFQIDLQQDPIACNVVEVAVVVFSSDVQVIQDFVLADQFQVPRLVPSGVASMGLAISVALDLVDTRKGIFRQNGVPYYRPWIVLLTDGSPTDEWFTAAQRVHQGEESKKFSFFTVGLGYPDMGILQQIAPQHRPPQIIRSTSFNQFFRWITESLRCVCYSKISESVQLPSISDWSEI